MAYIDNIKFKEILSASRDGNEKAKMVLQGMRNGYSQDDLDRLVYDYYQVEPEAVEPQVEAEADFEEENVVPVESGVVEEQSTFNEADAIDITDILKREMEGLIDEDEFMSVSFSDFLKQKQSNANRAKRNTDYFKVFDVDGRNSYADALISEYGDRFSGNLRDIERGYADNDKAIDMYSQRVADLLEDDVQMDVSSANSAYDEFVGDETVMGSFGRHWDENDVESIVSALRQLVDKYGKVNVMTALGVLKGDNEAHKDYLNNMIDTNIGKYTKSVDKLLR